MALVKLTRMIRRGIWIRQTLLLAFVAILPAVAILGSRASAQRSLERLESGLAPMEAMAEEVLGRISASIASLAQAYWGDRDALDESRANLKRATNLVEELLRAQPSLSDARLPNLLGETEQTLKSFGAELESSGVQLAQSSSSLRVASPGSGGPAPAEQANRTAALHALKAGADALAKAELVRDHVHALVEPAREDARRRSQEADRTVLTMIGGASVLYLFLSCLLLYRFLRPIAVGFGALGEVGAAGVGLNRRIELKGPDEVQSIVAAFNRLFEDLGSMVSRVSGSAGLITRASQGIAARSGDLTHGAHGQVAAIEDITSSIEEVAASVKSLAATSQDLAGRAGAGLGTIRDLGTLNERILARAEAMRSEVADMLGAIAEMNRALKEMVSHLDGLSAISGETSAGMGQIAATNRSVRENTDATLALGQEILADAEKGRERIARTVQAMGAIEAVNERTSRVVHSLEERAIKVGKILDVIDEVTDQTNLLAINASIFAAQAGDFGSGFGVVADEMKNLSARVAENSREIAILIRTVQAEIGSAAESIGAGSREIRDGVLVSRQAGEALERIAGGVGRAVERTEAISRASQEQAQSCRHALELVEQMSGRIGRIGDGVREQTGNEEQLMRAAMNLSAAAGEVSGSAHEAVKGMKVLIDTVEGMHELTQMVARSTAEERHAVDLVVAASREIDEIAHRHLMGAEELASTARDLEEQAGGFSRMVESLRAG